MSCVALLVLFVFVRFYLRSVFFCCVVVLCCFIVVVWFALPFNCLVVFVCLVRVYMLLVLSYSRFAVLLSCSVLLFFSVCFLFPPPHDLLFCCLSCLFCCVLL